MEDSDGEGATDWGDNNVKVGEELILHKVSQPRAAAVGCAQQAPAWAGWGRAMGVRKRCPASREVRSPPSRPACEGQAGAPSSPNLSSLEERTS
jgi:hypothetical protein